VLLDFADREIVESLCFQLRQLGTVFRLGEKVASIGFDESRDRVFAKLESGKNVHGQGLLYTIGRQASDQLNIEATGVKSDGRGKLHVNENFQTEVAHIYAAGDVIGFPALASTSMEQGRLASCHMFGKPGKMLPT
jgi:NAD(P) transhydrogenase